MIAAMSLMKPLRSWSRVRVLRKEGGRAWLSATKGGEGGVRPSACCVWKRGGIRLPPRAAISFAGHAFRRCVCECGARVSGKLREGRVVKTQLGP